MYWNWTSLIQTPCPETNSTNRSSVLEKLPIDSAKEIVNSLVRHVVSTLGLTQPPQSSSFNSDEEVQWCLQVICFGLSLPLTEHDVIKDSVNIYCEWLSCLTPTPKISVPKPIIERPNFYGRKIINHLYHLFTTRRGDSQDTINRQAVLCHRVLRTLQNLVKSSETLDDDTWECILLFLISINEALLSPPSLKDDIGDQLCERVLSVLFEVWLLACHKSFPSPPLWKTLRESCQAWRHRSNLFEQWNRVTLCLTYRVLVIMYGADYIKADDDLSQLLPANMSNDCIVQAWFRFLHCVGNPVELTQPTIISKTQCFLQYAIGSEDIVDPCQHPCLTALPSIFYQAMLGISTIVDAFLGIPWMNWESASESCSPLEHSNVSNRVPPMRRLAKSFSIAQSSNVYKGFPRPSLAGLGLISGKSKDSLSLQSTLLQSSPSVSSTTSLSLSAHEFFHSHSQASPSIKRPKVNSVLHLVGMWLFEASLISTESHKFDGEQRRTSRGSAVPAALPESVDIPHEITLDKYFHGRAEALAILCRIFCSKKTGEEILPAYVARFYICLRKAFQESKIEILAAILLNSANLLKLDLDGVNMLVPSIVSALELVLPTKDTLKPDVRRSSIQLLISMLALPLHFMNLPVKDLGDRATTPVTFLQLKPRLANLLIGALQVEIDSTNIQMLLGGLLLFVMDTSLYEETDRVCSSHDTESPTNLLSSENASIRSVSEYSNSFDEHTIGLSDLADGQFDSAHAMFVRATYLVCHRLISTWKMDLTVSLAALELLKGLARAKVYDQDPLECRRAVKWICDFIIHQCSRPPPAHSKDLHSSIVVAFSTLTNWLTEHPYLLEDKESLGTVLEVVEYGISGTKSQGKPGEPLKLKDEKDLKPVSLRVRDAAEALLTTIFEQVGLHDVNHQVRNSTMIDEYAIWADKRNRSDRISRADVLRKFRYYVMDQTILLALFEDQSGGEDPQPLVTALMRGPTGRHSWRFEFRHTPKNKEKSFSSSNSNPGRPLPMNDTGTRVKPVHRYFPEGVDKITACKADNAIPSIEMISLSNGDHDSYEESRLSMILESQIKEEIKVLKDQENVDEGYALRSECVPPPLLQEFQSARLLLSHLGYISPSERIDPNQNSRKLVVIDSENPEFINEIDVLDSISFKTCDTVHVFYVKANQQKPEEILENVQSRANINPHFLEFLLTLGEPTSVNRHDGWTGNVSTSYKCTFLAESANCDQAHEKDDDLKNDSHGGSLYNGVKQFLYWSDVTSEIAFIVPTLSSMPIKKESDSVHTLWNLQNNDEEKKVKILTHTKSLESSTEKFQQNKQFDDNNKPKKAIGKICDTKILIIWLESFEDLYTLPTDELMKCTHTGLELDGCKQSEPSLIIFIHSMKNGLFRIRMEGQSLRMGLATPLIDGMVLSRRVLGNLVRQTALNMGRRKRLENDNFQPPHVRRKLKIQEIMQKFSNNVSESEFYTHFYKNLPSSVDQQDIIL